MIIRRACKLTLNQSRECFMDIVRHEWLRKNIGTFKPSCIVVKITQNCNLRCKYCYTQGGKRKKIISADTVLKFFDQIVVDNASDICCIFHGGEPLLHPELINEIIDKLKARYYGPRIKYQIQTNATLITDEVIKLIKAHNISVGISADGYKEVNDCTRYYPDGSSSYEKVEKGIKKLHENDIPFGILVLISKYNVKHITEILDWCKLQGIERTGFNFFTPLGYGREEDLAANVDDLIENIKREIDWLINNNEKEMKSTRKFIYEREIEAMAGRVLDPEKCGYMCKSIPCGAGKKHLALDVDGSINVCDCFYGMSDFVIGNINELSLNECLNNSIIEEFQSRSIDKLKGCEGCDIKAVCHGGCPGSNVLFLKGKEGLYNKSSICDFYHEIYKYLIQKLKKERINPKLLTHVRLEKENEKVCCE